MLVLLSICLILSSIFSIIAIFCITAQPTVAVIFTLLAIITDAQMCIIVAELINPRERKKD